MADNKNLIYTITVTDKGTFVIKELKKEVKDSSALFKTLNADMIKNAQAGKLSASAMLAQINQLKQLRNANTSNNNLFRKQTEEIRLLENEYKKLTLVTQQQTDKTGLASATLVEFSRGVQDANYGFRGVANNLSQLTTLMTTLIGTTGGLKNAWVALKNAFTGPIGFLVVANIVIAALERLEIMSQKTTKTTDEMTDALADADGLTASLKRYADIAEDATKTDDERTVALQRLKDDGYDPLIGSLEDFLDAKRQISLFNATEKILQGEEKDFLVELIQLQRDLTAQTKAAAEPQPAFTPFRGTGITSATVAEEEMKKTKGLIEENKENLIRVNDEIVDAFEKVKADLKDNPFFSVLFGVDGDGEKGVRKPKVKMFDFGDAGDLLGRLFQDIEAELEKRDSESKSKKNARLRRLLGLPTDEEQKDELGKFLDSEKERIDLKEEEHKKDLKRIEERKQANEKLTQMLMSQIGNLASIQNKAFEGQITRLNTERDIILNNDNLTAKEKNRLLKENDRQSREIKIKQIKFERDMFQIEAAMELAKLTMAANGVLFNIGASATQGTLDATSSIGKFLQQLGPIAGPVAFAAMIGGVIAQISSARKAAEQQIKALSGPLKGVNAGGGGSAPIASPAFNVVGATQESQLAQTISQAEQQPIKAFVVASDVSTAQELERSTIEGASIG
jgi:hypothetical protein